MITLDTKVSAQRVRRLWENRVSLVLSNLEKGERQHREIANAASHIGADYHGRFLIELLQNASDQAVKAELSVSTLVLVRTLHSVALVNQGMPFDEEGLKSITSLALSPKNAEESLGNKGVGFKAVFQVSDGPEIFSTASANEGLAGGMAHAFRLDKAPLERTDVRGVIVGIAEQCLAAQPRAREAIEAMAPGEPAVDVIMREIAASPPWKFPIELGDADLVERASSLGLESEWLEMMQTLVVLPLMENEATRQVVERAIDEVRIPETLLFLPRVNELIIVDRTRNVHERVQKKAVTKPTFLSRGERIVEWETSVTRDESDAGPGQRWWIAARTMGDPAGIGDEAAELERRAIKQAAGGLPGDGWAKVERAVVSVALSRPELGSSSLPREHGVFCIGLPTGARTGLPFWVDAHFHGSVSRTGIDFEIPYNALLLDEAEILASALVEHLKREPSVEARRSVTLAMLATTGQLATRFWSPNGLAHSDVVLAADGKIFLKGIELAMPHVDDLLMLRVLTSDSDSIARSAGFVLPEKELLANARKLLDALATPAKAADYDGRFLARHSSTLSLVESAAARHRTEGPDFWEPFLTWLIKRFRFGVLEDQVVLPVGPEGLACAKDRVFIQPIGSPDTGQPLDDEEVDASTLHEDVRRALRFLDPNAITIRTGTRRDVTPLVAQLSPLAGARLVSRPRVEQLLEYAVAPRIAEVSRDPASRELTMELLRFAIELTQRLKGPKVRARVDFSAILVPAARHGESWEWVSPNTAYFGPGWTDEETSQALECAFGYRPHARLVPWESFAAAAGAQTDDARSWWSTGMFLLGVMDKPRVLTAEKITAFKSWSYDHLTPIPVRCPIEEASAFFGTWATSLSQRQTDRKGGQYYEISSVSWIDGLENEHGRAAVFRLVLAQPGFYANHAKTSVQRIDGGNALESEAMWLHSIRSRDWPILDIESDVHPALSRPSCAFWLTADERRKESSRLLAAIPARFSEAVPLLARLGVTTLAEASLSRVIAALHQFASLPTDAWEQRPIAARALVGDLWDRLRAHCARQKEEPHRTLAALLEHPIPMFRGRMLERIDLREIEFLYVNDEPIRANFVQGIDHALLLPLMRDVQALVRALRAVIGADRVRTTSEAPVITGFVAATGGASVFLLDLLDDAFPENNVPVDLGMLRAFGGRRDVDPRQKDFTDFRTDLERTRVVRGKFEAGGRIAPPRSFYEKSTSTLQVASDALAVDIVEGSWQIAGSAYRELWSSYSKALSESKVAQFFAEREIGDADREMIEVVMQRGQNARLAMFRSAALAIRIARGHPDLGSFYAGWDQHARSIDDLATWLGGDMRPVLQVAIDLVDEGQASRLVLAAAGVGVEVWQAARAALGLAPWSFEETRRNFIEARNTLVAALKSETARLFRVDLDTARGVLEALAATMPSEELSATYRDSEDSLEQALAVASDRFAACESVDPVRTLVDRVDALTSASRKDRPGLLDKLGTARERDVYRRDAEMIRSHQATEECDNLLRVAVPLAAHRGEVLEYATITADARVHAFSSGFWANRFGVLVALQHAIVAVAPNTAKALSEQRAFHEHVAWRDLWNQVPELGAIPEADAPPKLPPRVIGLFGADESEDTLHDELSQGSTGGVGSRVRALVEASLDLAGLGQGERPQIAVVPGVKGSRGGGGSGTGDAKADRELNGLLGEIFVYEQLRTLLSNFDEYAWVSQSRADYGFADGDDGLGYDFRYVDLDGTLSGFAKPVECLIEVKSTSGDGSAPFPLTINEWLRAEACHLSGGDICYMILRVAFVRTHPRIVDVIRNPVALAWLGQLSVSSKDLWVRVAGLEADGL